MGPYMLSVVVSGLMFITGPVLGQSVPQPAHSQELADAVLPPDLDRVLRDYEHAWRAGDAAALASLFAVDGFVLQSNRPPARGRRSIQAAYEGQGGSPLRLRALAFAADDTTGYIIGAYGYGDASEDTGKFTLTLRRTPGKPWLIFSDMDNSNVPKQQSNVSDTSTPAGPPTIEPQSQVKQPASEKLGAQPPTGIRRPSQ